MKEYIGDGVYLEFDAFGRLVLTTENGYGASNTIVLEPEVYWALRNIVDKYLEKRIAEDKSDE